MVYLLYSFSLSLHIPISLFCSWQCCLFSLSLGCSERTQEQRPVLSLSLLYSLYFRRSMSSLARTSARQLHQSTARKKSNDLSMHRYMYTIESDTSVSLVFFLFVCFFSSIFFCACVVNHVSPYKHTLTLEIKERIAILGS
jgi:hypothetical protein